MRRSHYSGIPTEFLVQMGNYDIEVNGVKMSVHVIDSVAAVDKHIAEMRSRLECGTEVVGMDYKKPDPGTGFWSHILVLYALHQCLIIQVDRIGCSRGAAPESLDNFLSDPHICFVGITMPQDVVPYYVKFSHRNTAAKAGKLVARVLKKPDLIRSSLADLAREVGVEYKSPASVIKVDTRNPMVLTEDQVMAALTDAFAYYQIGFKLLTSL